MEQKKRRPGVVTAIGILAVVFCSIGLLFSFVDVVMHLSGGTDYMLSAYTSLQTPANADLFHSMMTVISKYGLLMLLSSTALLCIRGAGLAGGILLLSAKSLGRTLLIAYAGLCFCHLIFSTVWMRMYLNEITASVHAAAFSSGDPVVGATIVAIMKVSMYAGLVIGVIFGAAWPVVVMVFMNRKSVKEYVA